MTTMATLLDRVSLYLQDTDHVSWSLATKNTQLLEEIARVSRQELLGEIDWQQGVQGEGTYNFGDTVVGFAEVLYDGRSLRFAKDESLARYDRQWQTRERSPQFYTTMLESPQTVRIAPMPLFTGDAAPQIPGLPLMQREPNNLIAYLWVNSQIDETNFELPDALEDVVVFATVGSLCMQPTEWQDLQKGATFQQLSQLMLSQLLES